MDKHTATDDVRIEIDRHIPEDGMIAYIEMLSALKIILRDADLSSAHQMLCAHTIAKASGLEVIDIISEVCR